MKTQIMGILNVTPDSFFEKWEDPSQAIRRGIEMYEQGADIIDVGGESTRPGATFVEEEEELKRVLPVIKALKNEISVPISIDTYKFNVARKALDAGASFINDVTGFKDTKMRMLAASAHVPICLMHMQKTPQTMQIAPCYPEGVLKGVLQWFDRQATLLLEEGVKKENIFLDPGIGFGKTVTHNIEIIQNFSKIKALGFPLLIGVSRKSFLKALTKKTTEELLIPSLIANALAVLKGANIVRVHDVKEHRLMLDFLEHFNFEI